MLRDTVGKAGMLGLRHINILTEHLKLHKDDIRAKNAIAVTKHDLNVLEWAFKGFARDFKEGQATCQRVCGVQCQNSAIGYYMIDLGGLSGFNAHFSMGVGDIALKTVRDVTRDAANIPDAVSLDFGGDEFIVLEGFGMNVDDSGKKIECVQYNNHDESAAPAVRNVLCKLLQARKSGRRA